MWYRPYRPPLLFVSPFGKVTFSSSMRASSAAPVTASVTCPEIEIGRSITERIPGHTIAASASALSYGGWNCVWVSMRKA